MQLLLDAGADINLRTEEDDSGMDPFMTIPSTTASTPLHVLISSMSLFATKWALVPELPTQLITWMLSKGAQLEAVEASINAHVAPVADGAGDAVAELVRRLAARLDSLAARTEVPFILNRCPALIGRCRRASPC